MAWSARPFVQLVRDALAAEGQSPELVQVVQGYGETGQALIEGGVDSLVFIGSVGNGRRVLLVEVNHRPRAAGTTKYGLWNRLWVGIGDLLMIWWLLRRRRQPGAVTALAAKD